MADPPPVIEPPDVFRRVSVVHGELERIRFVMGRPENRQAPLRVRGAAPREVYFQALTLFRKSNRLCFEQTRDQGQAPAPTGEKLTPGDVYTMVEAALERLQVVKAKLGIAEETPLPQRDATKTPTDVFVAIVDANRQLNLLLERQYMPSDVYQQVTIGVAYLSRLLEQFPEAETIPEEPPFEVGKRPADVYRRLNGCFERVCKIVRRTGESCLELEADQRTIDRAVPSDVYDIASLLVSELAFLHNKVGGEAARKVYYPGRKFPSHVYQRVGLLERQLAELESLIAVHPEWLERGSLHRRLLRSHLLVAAIGVAMLLVTLGVAVWARHYSARLMSVRTPTVQSSTRVQTGLQRTLASLRGWTIIDDPQFRADRRRTWRDEIEPALAKLKDLSEEWSNPENVARLAEVQRLLRELKQAQWWVEEVAQTPGNEPARVLVSVYVDPPAENIAELIDSVIELEKQQPGEAR
ncbi:Uncharacterized protein SCF082_LOCUS12669, partial [Durusdinium trenchii]